LRRSTKKRPRTEQKAVNEKQEEKKQDEEDETKLDKNERKPSRECSSSSISNEREKV
jgi:hypothetical protein